MSQNIQHTPQFLQKRKMALVLPLFVTPVACLLFWLFDGGTQAEARIQNHASNNINTKIPAPLNVSIEGSKLNAYLNSNPNEEKKEQIKNLLDCDLESSHINNPESSVADDEKTDTKNTAMIYSPHSEQNAPPDRGVKSKKEKEEDEFTRQLNALYQNVGVKQSGGPQAYPPQSSFSDEKTDRRLASIKNTSDATPQTTGSDQWSEALGKATGGKKIKKDTSEIYEVSTKQKKQIGALTQVDPAESSPEVSPNLGGNRFYTVGTHRNQGNAANTISAVIHQDQTLSEGSTVKLRTLSDINVNGKIVPKNSFVYGVAKFSRERIDIEISNIRYKNDILPFHLEVYDQDGLKGIHIPGAKATGKGGKEILAQVVDGIQPPSTGVFQQPGSSIIAMHPINTGQYLALEGVRAAVNVTKSLISGGLRKERVYVKANYRVYLKK